MMQYDLPALREQIIATYSENELKDLCFNMEVDYDIIEGADKAAKARELLTYLHRRDRVAELILHCMTERPKRDWNLVKTQKEQSEEFRNTLGLGVEIRNRYLDRKYEIYCSVWNSLYALKEAGDALWESASRENIANFASLLRQARNNLGVNALFFDKEDYMSLETVMGKFGSFHAGKGKLYDIRSTNDERTISPEKVRRQVLHNGELKAIYEVLLDRVLESFRTKITQMNK
jgi:hypothetical protein